MIERETLEEIEGIESLRGLLAIDSFSYLTLDVAAARLSALLRQLRRAGRSRRLTVVLATDRGMFDPRAEAVVIHLADGFIQFHSKEGPEGIVRFLRVPKWTEGKFVDRNVYYDYDGRRLAIDLRRRVL